MPESLYTSATDTVALPTVADGERRRGWRAALDIGRRHPSVWLALAWLLFVLITSVLADHLGLPDPRSQDLRATLEGPSWAHPLGTDGLGRDVLSRIVHGGGELMLVSLVPVVIAYAIGIPLGLLAGYAGGWVDHVSSFFVNVLFSIPGIVVVLAVAAATDASLGAMTIAMGIVGAGAVLRMTRASTVTARELLYVDAARVARLPRSRILGRHVLPNVAGPLIVQAFLMYGGLFLFFTSLSFLALGFDPEQPSWGQMTVEASGNLRTDPWLMVPIGAVIIFTVLSINTLGTAALRLLPSQFQAETAARMRLSGARRRSRGVRLDEQGAPASVPHATGEPSLGVEVEGLVIRIPGAGGGAPLVRGVSLRVAAGRTLALVGESGSGKTLTALAIGRLLPPEAQIVSGSIHIGGRDVRSFSERRFRALRGSTVAYIAQEPALALDPCFSVRSQLVEVIRSRSRISRRAARTRAAELLDLVGIRQVPDVLRSFPHQLSGGMAQRVAIAIAISGDPELIIADEPTTALDVTVQADILDLLRDLQLKLGMTIVLITHDMGVVADMADDVFVMKSGTIIESGPVRDILRDPREPYTRRLLQATRMEFEPSGAAKDD